MTIKDKVKRLYADLLKIKDDKDFKFYGFGKGGPHFKWAESIKELRKESGLSVNEKIVLAELEQLGFAYIGSALPERTMVILDLTSSICEFIKEDLKTEK